MSEWEASPGIDTQPLLDRRSFARLAQNDSKCIVHLGLELEGKHVAVQQSENQIQYI
jgi:hypothetical protein